MPTSTDFFYPIIITRDDFEDDLTLLQLLNIAQANMLEKLNRIADDKSKDKANIDGITYVENKDEETPTLDVFLNPEAAKRDALPFLPEEFSFITILCVYHFRLDSPKTTDAKEVVSCNELMLTQEELAGAKILGIYKHIPNSSKSPINPEQNKFQFGNVIIPRPRPNQWKYLDMQHMPEEDRLISEPAMPNLDEPKLIEQTRPGL